nr:hypothetical protein [Tanacetum cinerariifolium]
MLDEKFVLVDDDEKTLKKVQDSVNADSDSELDERYFDLRPYMLGPRYIDIEKGTEQYFAKRYVDDKWRATRAIGNRPSYPTSTTYILMTAYERRRKPDFNIGYGPKESTKGVGKRRKGADDEGEDDDVIGDDDEGH